MTDMSRRTLFTAGGTIGALAAMAAAAPAQARVWDWAPSGSVAGSGQGSDPVWEWDDEADPLVASLYDRGLVPQVNTLLATWKTNSQPLPAGLPSDLRDFMEEARKLPTWADSAKLQKGADFNMKRGTYLGVLYGMASGMMSTVIPHEARAVYWSKGGADMKDRIAKTAKLGYDVGALNAYKTQGSMIVTAVKTRLVHAAVRHLLPQSPHWTAATTDQEIPISQRDMMVTWHSLATTVMAKMRSWNLSIPTSESEGYLHTWQVTAHMLGIKDEYIPASWADADRQAAQVLTPILAPTTEGVSLADTLMNIAVEVDGGMVTRPLIESMTRYMLGDQIASWLEIPRHPALDASIKGGWPMFVRMREAGLPLFMMPAAYWAFDEFLRQGVLLFLNEGKPININLPMTNRPEGA